MQKARGVQCMILVRELPDFGSGDVLSETVMIFIVGIRNGFDFHRFGIRYHFSHRIFSQNCYIARVCYCWKARH